MVRQLVGTLRNLSADFPRMLFVDEAGRARVTDVSEDLFAETLERALPVRDFFAWPGKRNYEGLWWSSRNHTLVRFESLLERQAIEWFDFDPTVAGLSAQPFALLWARGTAGQSWHVPDLFIRRADGSALVVDVRPADRVDADAADQFRRTRAACSTVGWNYEVFAGLPEPLGLNVRFVSGYRFDRCRPNERQQAQLVRTYGSGQPLETGVDDLTNRLGEPRATVLVHIYHLLWRQILHVDLNEPLRMDSTVRS